MKFTTTWKRLLMYIGYSVVVFGYLTSCIIIPIPTIVGAAASYIATTTTVTTTVDRRYGTVFVSPRLRQHQPARESILQRRSTVADTTTTTSDNNSWEGNDIYQRIFYRFSPGSDVTIHDAIVIEERCRYIVDPQRLDYIIPSGPRTIIMRNAMGLDFDSGEIGEDFFTIHVASTTSPHNGAGNDPTVQSAIACAMYLSSNPEICHGRMIELSSDSGLGSLLGCIGAGYVRKYEEDKGDTVEEDVVDDILTIGKDRKGPFPPGLDLLSITDVDEQQLIKIMNNLKASGLKSGYKVNVDVLDWRTRSIQSRNSNRLSSSQSPEYQTVVASDVVFSYPETKELARTVANRLEPITPYLYQQSGSSSVQTALPRFVHVCPDDRDDVTYLRRILEKGYRMAISTKFLKLEKLIFQFQKLPSGSSEMELDDLELDVKEYKEIKYQALVAQHHPDYSGGGSGELFFPMETGEYEATGGSTFLEKEAGSSPW